MLLLDVSLFERAAVRSAPLQHIGSHLLLIRNYSHWTFKGLDGTAWTMSVEAQFHVLLLLMAAALTWLANRGRVPLLLGAVLLASLSTLTNVSAIYWYAFSLGSVSNDQNLWMAAPDPSTQRPAACAGCCAHISGSPGMSVGQIVARS